jgi:hypothetical protein
MGLKKNIKHAYLFIDLIHVSAFQLEQFKTVGS